MYTLGFDPTKLTRPRRLADFTAPQPEDAAAAEAMAGLRRIAAPPETIEPEHAPVARKIYNPGPDMVAEGMREDAANPERRFAALGVTPTEAELLRTASYVPERPERQEVKRGGFWGTLKSLGRGALQSMAMAGPNASLGERLGAGLGGAIRGGVSPQNVEDVDYLTRRLPMFNQQMREAQDAELRRERLRGEIGQRTGYDVTTGQELPETRRRRIADELDREREARIAEDADLNIEARRLGIARQRLNDILDAGLPVPVDVARAAGAPELAGKTKAQTSKKPDFIEGTGGRWFWNPTTSRIEQTPGAEAMPPMADRNAPTPYQRSQMERQERQDTQERRTKATQAESAFNAAKRAAGIAAQEYGAKANEYGQAVIGAQRQAASPDEGGGILKGEKLITPESLAALKSEVDILKAKAEAAKQAMLDAHGVVSNEYGDLFEAGEDKDGNPYIKPKARAAAVTSPGKVTTREKAQAYADARFNGDLDAAMAAMRRDGWTIQ